MNACRLVALWIFFLLLSACSRNDPHEKTSLRYRVHTQPPSLDWSLGGDTVSSKVFISFMEGLLAVDANGKVENRLAESYKASLDGKIYTFKIRPARWSDGVELTAQHFVDSWERLLNAKTGAEYSYFFFDIENAENYQKGKLKDFSKVGVKALDARTLEVRLRKPVVYWALVTTFFVSFPQRKDLIEKYGDKWTDPGKMLSVGPYVLSEHRKDSLIQFEKNPHYWDPDTLKLMPDRLEFRVIKEDNTAVALFDSKKIDLVWNLPPLQTASLSKRKEFRAFDYLRMYYTGFNLNDPATKDMRVRRALALAIDRSEFEKVIGPVISARHTWIPATLLGADQPNGILYDPEAAKKLWSQIPNPPQNIEFWFDTKERNRLVAEILQNQWKKVLGLNVTLQNQEWKVYLKKLSTSAPALYRQGWAADYQDTDTFMGMFICASGNNYGKFCDPKYDELIGKAAITKDIRTRSAYYARAERILLNDKLAIVPLFQEKELYLVSQRVEGFRPNLMGDFAIRDIRLK